MIAVHHGDCREIIPTLGVTVDAVVTDAPYDLVAMTKRFGKGYAPAKSPDHQRFARGFMNQTWDGTGVAFDPETWRIVGQVMRPGAFLCAFGGTRTYHRMTCAIEDAGFVIQDCIMWLYGSGFPKRRDMLKPAYEPIVLAYKPGGKRTLQVGECRISTNENRARMNHARTDGSSYVVQKQDKFIDPGGDGRWPANVCHDGSDEVMEAFPDAPGQLMRVRPDYGLKASVNCYGDFGARAETSPRADSGTAARFFYCAKADKQDRWSTLRHEVTISWTSESGPCQAVLLVATALSPPRVIAASGSTGEEEWNTFLFGSGLTGLCRKASKSTIRMTTSSTIDLKTWSWLTRSLTSDFTPVATLSTGNGSSHAAVAASTSLSVSFILAETVSLPNASRALSGALFAISGTEKIVSHPTVKPIALIEWLVKLVCPKGGTVLDPFAGSGTTAVAALAAGRNAILIEREDQYIADIRERVAFYEGEGRHSMVAKNRNRGNGVGALRDGGRGRPVADDGPLFGISTATANGSRTPQPNTDESKSIIG